MKRSQLQALIREALDEVLNEIKPQAVGVTRIDSQDPKKNDIVTQLTQQNKSYEIVPEGDLNEMAWGIAGNRLQYYKKTSLEREVEIPQRLTPQQQNIINVLRQSEGEIVSDKEIQDTLGLSRPQMVNSQLSNIFTQAPAIPAAVQPGGPEGGEEPEDDGEDELPAGYEDPEGGVEGDMSDEEIDASFARVLAGDDDENIEDIEVDDTTPTPSTSSMSDEDYEAFMQYTDLETRLARVKSDLRKKTGTSTPGDIKDTSKGIDVKNLIRIRDDMQKKMNDLVSNSPYLQKRIAKMSEPKELDEWTKNKLQYYAGIIK